MLSQRVRNQLRIALQSSEVATTVADTIDSGGGVLNPDARRVFVSAMTNKFAARRICAMIEAGQPLDEMDIRPLARTLGSYPAAVEIQTALAGV